MQERSIIFNNLNDLIMLTMHDKTEIHLNKDKNWTYGETFNTREKTLNALKYCKYNNKAYLESKKIKNKLAEILTKNAKRQGLIFKRKLIYSQDDGELILEKLQYGEAKPYRQFSKIRRGNIIRIGINCWLSCGNNEDSFYKISARALGVAEAFKSIGLPVEIVLFGYTKQANCFKGGDVDHQIIMTTLIKSDQHLNPARLLSIGIPGFARDFMARADVVCYYDGDIKKNSNNWSGRCKAPPEYILKKYGIDIYVGQSWGEECEEELIINTINNILKKEKIKKI